MRVLIKYKSFCTTDYSFFIFLYKKITLKLENMKKELLVIVNHNVTVNGILCFVHTARQVLGVEA